MAWIKVIPPQEAAGELAEYYRRFEKDGHPAGEVLQAISLNPRALQGLEILQNSFEEHGVLSPKQCEMIAVVTSALNRCDY